MDVCVLIFVVMDFSEVRHVKSNQPRASCDLLALELESIPKKMGFFFSSLLTFFPD